MRIEVIGNCTLYNADCLEVLPTLSNIDACVTDPPYHLQSIVSRFKKNSVDGSTKTEQIANDRSSHYGRLSRGFMGQAWDGGDIAFRPETWELIIQTLKPGAHLTAFSGTRTCHRMVCAIEDAGFEIRDQLAWVFGSGFPKSHNIAKAIDKSLGNDPHVIGTRKHPTLKDLSKINELAHAAHGSNLWKREWELTQPSSSEGKQWEGWGTALKPAQEPISLSRKPISEKSIAENVLKYGTGALNIEACLIKTNESTVRKNNISLGSYGIYNKGRACTSGSTTGRWPANIIHDGSDEVLAIFPETNSTRANGNPNNPKHGLNHKPTSWCMADGKETHDYRDTGSAARFFYCAKTSSWERDIGLEDLPSQLPSNAIDRASQREGSENNTGRGSRSGPRKNIHPTVKPYKLMAWLCKLITPPTGIVLDPFMGSGSTGMACVENGFHFIGIEQDPTYFDIACKRIEGFQKMQKKSLDEFFTL